MLAKGWTWSEVRASRQSAELCLPRPLWRLPAEGATQIKGVSSHLKIEMSGRHFHLKLREKKTILLKCFPSFGFELIPDVIDITTNVNQGQPSQLSSIFYGRTSEMI